MADVTVSGDGGTTTVEVTQSREGRFRFWCQKVLPAVYDDSLSYYELLCKVVAHLNTMVTVINNNADSSDELQDRIKAIEDMLGELMEGGLEEIYNQKMRDWLDQNMWCMLSWAARCVWFGITDDGYFCAYIPDNMNFLVFDTIMDPDSEYYGCLTMSYCQEVYQPCEISCWDGDCVGPDRTIMSIGEGM